MDDRDKKNSSQRLTLCTRDRDLMKTIIAFSSRHRYAVAICPELKECFHFMRRKKSGLCVIDAVEDPVAVQSVAWELRKHSIHAPFIAVVDPESGFDDDTFYRFGFDAVIDCDSDGDMFEKVLLNYMHVDLSH